MSNLYKPFLTLSCWKDIQKTYSYLEHTADPNGQLFFLQKSDIDKISDLLIEDVRKVFGSNYNLIGGGFFCQPSKKIRDHVVHVDGNTHNKDKNIKFALNIPIVNCDQGEMVWYEGDYKQTLVDESGVPVSSGPGKYFDVEWTSDPIQIDSKIIDSPHIVKVDIPHKVVNHSDKFRVLLTTRFSPDLYI